MTIITTVSISICLLAMFIICLSYNDKFMDSYTHYRDKVGLGIFRSIYRALYYEIKGKEPWA